MKLNSEQLRAVSHRDGPMLVLAGPGSGKTAVLVNRVLNLVEREGTDPHDILVLTFSRAAAIQMQERFNRLSGTAYPVTFGTFHAIFYHILKSQGLYRTARIITPQKKIELMKHAALIKRIEKVNDPVFLARLTDLAGIKKAMGEGRLKYADESELEALFLVYEEYSRLVKDEGYIDFEDMIHDCLKMLKSNDKILRKWQDRFPYILVDEFQDIDESQYEILRLLSLRSTNIFCVGDDDQAIYSFRGSDPAVMKKFAADHAGMDPLALKVNYRCPGRVIKHAYMLISNNKDRFEKKQIPVGNDTDNCIIHRCFKNAGEEAGYLIKMIKGLVSVCKKKDMPVSIGVLYRISRSGDLIEEELKRSGIFYTRKDRSVSFYGYEWVKDVISYLRLSIEPDINDIIRVLNRPERGLIRECIGNGTDIRESMLLYYQGNEYEKKVKKLFEDLDFIKDMSCFGAVNYILRGVGLMDHFRKEYGNADQGMDWEERAGDLLDRARSYKSAGEWLRHIEQIADEDETKDKGADPCGIELRTIHAAKGLEYDNVFMIGLQEGVFPLKKYDDDDALAEERRLFYVGMTRCRKRLWLTGIKRDEYGKGESRFIKEAGLEDETLGRYPDDVV